MINLKSRNNTYGNITHYQVQHKLIEFQTFSWITQVALRWRVENEVVMGKGQFQCGNKRCTSDKQLRSWEVNFAYVEENQKKNALVKIRKLDMKEYF